MGLYVVRTGKDAGDIYFEDVTACTVYVWKPSSHQATLVAENLLAPTMVAVDEANNLLYIYANGVVIVDLATGNKYSVAGISQQPHGWSVAQGSGKVIYVGFRAVKSFETTCPQNYLKKRGLCAS